MRWLPLIVLVACGDEVQTREPLVEAGPSDALPLLQATEDEAAIGFRVSGRVHPRGRPGSWHVEYGPTPAYGSATAPRPLPAKLAAHFAEDWSSGLAGWSGGFLGTSLARHDDGDGPYLRYTDRGAEENDVNHLDGIGLIHLPMYGYLGNVSSGVLEQPSLVLGGGHPDLRGAKMGLSVRGVDWVDNGATLATWLQMDLDASLADQVPVRRANWANTGPAFGALLASGAWERAEWTLRNRPDEWTYAGQYGARNAYLYKELDAALGDVNVNIFPAQLVHVDFLDLPSGAIDFARLELTYRDHSVLAQSNGAELLTDGSELTDGWRFGAGHEWLGDGPHTFRWSLQRPITLTSLLVHNSPTNPTTRVDVRVSSDGVTFVSLGERQLPTSSPYGPNFLFHHQVTLDPVTTAAVPLHPEPITHLEVAVLAGVGAQWGLGEVEAFGSGASEQTDDEWYDVNLDVIVPPGTYHHRLVITTDEGTAHGADVTVIVPRPPPPTIESVDPAVAASAGGDYLTIYGTNMAHSRRVTIGGVEPIPFAIARGVTQVQLHPGTGTCDIVIETEFGSATLAAGFAYDDGGGQPDPGPCVINGRQGAP